MKTICLVVALFTVTSSFAKDIALTFDDCPRKTGPLMTGLDRAHRLVTILKENNVKQVAFFCNSPSRALDGKERIQIFAEAGHIIANHSATHPDFRKMGVAEYEKNIEQGGKDLEKFPNFRKWFRYPYLHEGNTEADRDAVRAYLKKIGYKNGYVTIDNGDYYMDDLLQQAVAAGQHYKERPLCETYSRIMLDQAEFHENIAKKSLGRSVKHVILMHETDLNAICLKTFIKTLRSHGWNIISPEDAYTDPIAEQDPNTLFLGQGRVAALASAKGENQKQLLSKWYEESAMRAEFTRKNVFIK